MQIKYTLRAEKNYKWNFTYITYFPIYITFMCNENAKNEKAFYDDM
jgi:hypothetical protein